MRRPGTIARESTGAGVTDANGNAWVPGPGHPEKQGFDDDGFTPVSKKVTGPSASSSSSGARPVTCGTGGTSSSSGTCRRRRQVLADGERHRHAGPREGAPIARRQGLLHVHACGRGVPADAHVSITRDLTEHRYGDGLYATFTVMFRDAEVTTTPSTDGPAPSLSRGSTSISTPRSRTQMPSRRRAAGRSRSAGAPATIASRAASTASRRSGAMASSSPYRRASSPHAPRRDWHRRHHRRRRQEAHLRRAFGETIRVRTGICCLR